MPLPGLHHLAVATPLPHALQSRVLPPPSFLLSSLTPPAPPATLRVCCCHIQTDSCCPSWAELHRPPKEAGGTGHCPCPPSTQLVSLPHVECPMCKGLSYPPSHIAAHLADNHGRDEVGVECPSCDAEYVAKNIESHMLNEACTLPFL